MGAVSWRITGEEVGGCSCAWGCPCQFNALPTRGRCEGFVTVRVATGHFGQVRLDGVRFAMAFSFPGAMHEGNGTVQLLVDTRASVEQRNAISEMNSGAHGGAIFEIFAAVAPNRPQAITAPLDIEADRERRTATLSLPGLVEHRAEPIRNPVTGEEHRAQIRLPNGFEYREAEMGNTAWLKVTVGPIAFEHRDCYAQFNAFDWSNQAAV
ncbi:MAG TPA: DUF1326 domain-containing protein [Vicinamibacterales bacterium]|nr:DUF1326 domain-containing protein [Vicinamibacterales bacterium]